MRTLIKAGFLKKNLSLHLVGFCSHTHTHTHTHGSEAGERWVVAGRLAHRVVSNPEAALELLTLLPLPPPLNTGVPSVHPPLPGWSL